MSRHNGRRKPITKKHARSIKRVEVKHISPAVLGWTHTPRKGWTTREGLKVPGPKTMKLARLEVHR